MATVRSLLCWGAGATKTVSISATTDLATLTNHGIKTGMQVFVGGTLPAELSSVVPYYGRAVSTSTFSLHTTKDGAKNNTNQVTFAGSTTYAAVTAISGYWTLLSAGGRESYGSAGAERLYQTVKAWVDARRAAGVGEYDIELLEVAETFAPLETAMTTFDLNCAETIIAPEVNGVKTDAWHAGVYGNGLAIRCNTTYMDSPGLFNMVGDRITIRDISIELLNYNMRGPYVNGRYNALLRCFVTGNPAQYGQRGVTLRGTACVVAHNIIANHAGIGFTLSSYGGNASIAAFNLSAKNTTGWTCDNGSAAESGGTIIGNIAVGNTTANWHSTMPAHATYTGKIGKNYGEYAAGAFVGGTPWWKTTNNGIGIATTDFEDWANNDFRPKRATTHTSTAPQVDSCVQVLGIPAIDIAGNAIPGWNDGAAAGYDGGPYKFDYAYGDSPVTLTIANLVDGSDIVFREAGTETVRTNVEGNAGTSYDYAYGDAGTAIDIDIYKPGCMPYTVIRGFVLPAAPQSLTVSQVQDPSYLD